MKSGIAFFRLLLATGLLLSLSGCGQSTDPGETSKKRGKSKRPVTLAEVAQRTVTMRYQRTGTLRHRRIVRIYNQEEGRILSLPFYEGDQVETGAVLAVIDEQLLSVELEKAKATTRQAEVNLKRIIDLDKRKVASQDELTRSRTALDVAKADEKVLSTRIGFATITAPFAGVITARLAEPGDVKSRNSQLLTLADPDSLITDVTVSELLIPHLQTGQTVQVRIDALRPQKFSGQISRIHPTLDPATHHGKLEIKLDPVPEGARAGQFVRVSLETETVPRLLIPFSALRRDRESEYVFIARDGMAVRTRVRSGVHIENEVEILQGLEIGQQVITRGFLGLRDGKSIKVIVPGDND